MSIKREAKIIETALNEYINKRVSGLTRGGYWNRATQNNVALAEDLIDRLQRITDSIDLEVQS
jgi:hypothetical protein